LVIIEIMILYDFLNTLIKNHFLIIDNHPKIFNYHQNFLINFRLNLITYYQYKFHYFT